MKKSLLLLFLIKTSLSFSQYTSSEEEFQEILNVQFSKIITGNTFSNFGNFASVSTDEKTLKAGVNIFENTGTIVNINVSGGATKGISDLFTDGELNSNISIDGTYHWISPFGKIQIERDTEVRDSFNIEEEKILKEYDIESMGAVRYKDLTFKELELKKFDDTRTKLLGKKNTVSNDASLAPTIKQLRVDSLSAEIEVVEYEMLKLEKKVKKLRKEKNEIEGMGLGDEEKIDLLKEIARQKRDKKLEALRKKRMASEIEAIKLSWFSFGLNYRNDSFKLFDESMEATKQVIDSSFTSSGFNFAYSHYNWSKSNDFDIFVSFGFSYSNTSNLSSLKSVEVVDTQFTSDDSQREVLQKQSAFLGEFKENIEQVMPFVDFYMFYGRTRTIALHINPTLLARDFQKPTTSVKLGLLVPFQKVDKQTSVVNLEIFYRLNDIFNTSESQETLLGRNTIGLQATFPINFLQ